MLVLGFLFWCLICQAIYSSLLHFFYFLLTIQCFPAARSNIGLDWGSEASSWLMAAQLLLHCFQALQVDPWWQEISSIALCITMYPSAGLFLISVMYSWESIWKLSFSFSHCWNSHLFPRPQSISAEFCLVHLECGSSKWMILITMLGGISFEYLGSRF